MFKYFATYVSGTQQIIERIVHERSKEINIIRILDGAIEFETNISYDSLNFFCFNNIFLVLDVCKATSENNPIEAFMRKIISKRILSPDCKVNSKKIKTFRVITSSENQLVSVNNNLKSEVELLIKRGTGLSVKRSDSDIEYWFLYRNEGLCYFLKRLSKHTAYDKILHKGELHPELAYMMCKLSNPVCGDIVVDPFCGYGAIVAQRSKRFPYTNIYAFDVNEEALSATRDKFYRKPTDKITIENLDVKKIAQYFKQGSVDAIITDPPWGLFEKLQGGINEFYDLFLKDFYFILKNHGVLILLTSQKNIIENIIHVGKQWILDEKYDILVSGKKSAIYKLRKNER